jgi:hypothetical protein
MFGLALVDELLGLSLEEEKPRDSGLAWTKTDGRGAWTLAARVAAWTSARDELGLSLEEEKRGQTRLDSN